MNAALNIRAFPEPAVCLADLRRETRIRSLGNLLNRERTAGNRDEAQRLWQELSAAIQARSPSQVDRMEQAMRHDGSNEYHHTPRLRAQPALDRLRAGERSAGC